MDKAKVIWLLLGWHLMVLATAFAQNVPRASTEGPAGTPEAGAPRAPNYQLSAGDMVSIKVFREPDLDSLQRLSKDGTINFPLLGVIRLGGMTTNEAAAHVASLLDRDYVHHPQVSVTITTYNKMHFTVLGQVATPGTFDIPEEQAIDLLSAIARAGGFTRLADQHKVMVRRMVAGQEDTQTINVSQMMQNKSIPRFVIEPNDTISVPERFF